MEKEGTSEYADKLKKYITTARSSGFTDDIIKQKLTASGVKPEMIASLFGEFSRESDVISQNDFEKIENKESKSVFKKFFTKKKTDTAEQKAVAREALASLNNVQLSSEVQRLYKLIENENVENAKQGGKIEILSQKNEEVSTQIESITEKVGELRSTVLARERMFNKLEDDFTAVKYVVNTFKPENLDKRFDELNKQILKLSTQVEKFDTRMKLVDEKLAVYNKLMGSIKNYETVITKLEKLKDTQSDMEKVKVEIDKRTSKMEVMFRNLEESIGKINITNNIAKSSTAAIKDIVLTMTKLEAQTEFLVKKEDFDVLKNDMNILKKTLFELEFAETKKPAEK